MRYPMPMRRHQEDDFQGFRVNEAVESGMHAVAPLAQAQAQQRQRGIDAEKTRQAIEYQKLLRTGADGMRRYAQEVSAIHPDLGKQLAQEAEQYATFYADPSLTGDKAESYASHFYESGNSRVKAADEMARKSKLEQEEAAKKALDEKTKKEKKTRFQAEFIPGVEGLVEKAKKDKEVRSDIAIQLAKSEHAGEDYANDFMRQLESERPPENLNKFNAGREDKTFDQEKSLRDKWEASTKDFRDVRDAYSRIQVSAKDPSPAGDLALIFNYMKMLDPGSTVREGEFATAQNSGSAFDILGAKYNKVLSGERLTREQRADFLGRAKALYGKQAKQAKKSGDETRRLARLYKLDPERVVLDQELFEDDSRESAHRKAPLAGKGASTSKTDDDLLDEILGKKK